MLLGWPAVFRPISFSHVFISDSSSSVIRNIVGRIFSKNLWGQMFLILISIGRERERECVVFIKYDENCRGSGEF